MRKDLRDVVFPVIHDLMRSDPNVVILHNDLGAFGLDAIKQEFPSRAVNVGVAEQNMMAMAGGLASAGKRVFVYGIISHLMRAWEMVKVCICVPNLPVTIIGWGSGLSSGKDGPTHHAVEDVGLMRTLANMTIYNPADWVCAEAVVRMACEARTPHYIRLDKMREENLYQPGHDFSAGYGMFGPLKLHTIVATGITTQRAFHSGLATIDVYRLNPAPNFREHLSVWDDGLSGLEVWDEHHPNGGLSSIVAEQLCSFERKTLKDEFLGAVGR